MADAALAVRLTAEFESLRRAGQRALVVVGPLPPTVVADVVLPVEAGPAERARAVELASQLARGRRQVLRQSRRGDRLRAIALADPLTLLPNRRAWVHEVRGRFASSPPDSRPAVALVDLDRFNEINEQVGLEAGDRLLAAVARALRSACMRGDFVARLGGDEFALLVQCSTRQDAIERTDAIREAAACSLASHGGPAVTASAGVAYSTEAASRTLLSLAEHALRQAKLQGGNRTIAAPDRSGQR
jgi:diguanylate cyclase (GGDEF)-like protein